MTMSRRRFIVGASTGLAISGLSGGTAAATPSVRLGAPVFSKNDDPGALAARHRELGYRAAYAPDVELTDRDRIRTCVDEFAKHDVVIAEVGAWVNLLDLNPEKKKENIEFVANRLALADELGARCCVDIAGSYNPEAWDGPHPENFSRKFFDETVTTVRQILDSVRPTRTRFSIEMMGWTLPSTPAQYLQLIQAVDRKSFAVHVDVCNMVNSPEKIYDSTTLIRDCFRKLGPWIVSCHAKDVAWVKGSQVHFQEVIPGRGELDYATYLKEIAQLQADVPLMIEHLSGPDEFREAADYIRLVARKSGVEL
jgi:sugar phosphate isomerase/epimerase